MYDKLERYYKCFREKNMIIMLYQELHPPICVQIFTKPARETGILSAVHVASPGERKESTPNLTSQADPLRSSTATAFEHGLVLSRSSR
jgi:hypothetical protein